MKLKKLYLLFLFSLFFMPVKSETEYNFYTGIFDSTKKGADDRASMYGLEHNDPVLFRDTFIGRFSPITGGFFTERKSIYLYTGVQAEYVVGPLNIIPSFAPGYYKAGKGKDLGMPLEFRSQIQVSFKAFKDSKIGYSYSHISNNDWGNRNPGVDNQKISISKNF